MCVYIVVAVSMSLSPIFALSYHVIGVTDNSKYHSHSSLP